MLICVWSTDYGFLTLVAQDDVGGLEVQDKDGGWIPAPPIPNTFVLNVADILQRWSGGRFVSTPHRVRNLSAVQRYSQPYFFDPSVHTVVAPLPLTSSPSSDTAVSFEPVRYGDYLMERLDKNYSWKGPPRKMASRPRL